MLEGIKFHVLTDHKPLIHALRRVSAPWSAKKTCHLAHIAEYTLDICHIPSAENVVADTLSRLDSPHIRMQTTPEYLPPTLPHIYFVTIPAPPPGVDYHQLAAQQTICPSVQRLSASTVLKIVLLKLQNVELLCDVSTGTPCLLVPDTVKIKMFSALHGISHPGVRVTRMMMSTRFVWKI